MSVVSERPLGQYPLSIGTSLALEGSVGRHPDRPMGPYHLSEFPHHRANLKTLFRNYYEAIGKDNITGARFDELVGGYYQELLTYRDIVHAESGGAEVAFYICDYIGLKQRMPHAMLRGDSTANQALYTKTMKAVISEVLKNDPEITSVYKLKIEEPARLTQKTLLFTHLCYDLTTRSYTNHMLLESHTGAIKDKSLWYTKYYRGKELTQIPFREDFLAIFGDTHMFSPLSPAFRKALTDLAVKYHWSFTTTREKIVYGLDSLKDRYLADKLKFYLL